MHLDMQETKKMTMALLSHQFTNEIKDYAELYLKYQ
jgi:hypothetical protein